MKKLQVVLHKFTSSDTALNIFTLLTYLLARVLTFYATKEDTENPIIGTTAMTFLMNNVFYPLGIGAGADMFIALLFTFIIGISDFFNGFKSSEKYHDLLVCIWTIAVKSYAKMFIYTFLISSIVVVIVIVYGLTKGVSTCFISPR